MSQNTGNNKRTKANDSPMKNVPINEKNRLLAIKNCPQNLLNIVTTD